MQNNHAETIYDENSVYPKYKNFLFFGSIRESVETLSEEEGNKLLRAVMIYGTEGILEAEDPLIKAILMSIKPNIDKAHANYQEAKKRTENYYKRKRGEM